MNMSPGRTLDNEVMQMRMSFEGDSHEPSKEQRRGLEREALLYLGRFVPLVDRLAVRSHAEGGHIRVELTLGLRDDLTLAVSSTAVTFEAAAQRALSRAARLLVSRLPGRSQP